MMSMRGASLVALALSAAMPAMPALADDPSATSAHEAVRAALLEQATMPVDHPATQGDVAGPAQHEHSARGRHEQAERAAHERAASHGVRHSREMRSEHEAGPSMYGPMRGGSGGAGWSYGMDCLDPAGNWRTWRTHDGWMPPPMDMDMGM